MTSARATRARRRGPRPRRGTRREGGAKVPPGARYYAPRMLQAAAGLALLVGCLGLRASADEGAERRGQLRSIEEGLRDRQWEKAAGDLKAFRASFPGTEEAVEAWVLEARALLRAGKARESLDATTEFLKAHGSDATRAA